MTPKIWINDHNHINQYVRDIYAYSLNILHNIGKIMVFLGKNG
mgnify:CR=1 FL=1